ncbi:unnamed protein product [Microthlaspi erraticum]|uniref:F-box domain-containing protein n=1 Tax=Microthlaspi erraticum TaxID=1685480 RepID=A0A6D2HUL2_9BRAS|nr:unnamed protein product [Microthlaspi erraticum]
MSATIIVFFTEIILARVSRWNYPSLCLVSKRFHSLLSSMQFYKTRSQIGAKETCAYVCLNFRSSPCPSWFSLFTKPNQTLTEHRGEIRFPKDPSGNSVVPTPFSSSHSHHTTCQSNFSIGSEIYISGGPWEEPSSSVQIFDCRSHTWRNGPNMTVAREDACARFRNEKIYVMGGCDIDEYSASWIEVFDMTSQSWTAFPGPGADEAELRNLLHGGYDYNIVNVSQGKLYVNIDEKEYTYELKDGTWKVVRQQSSSLLKSERCNFYMK